MAKRGLEKRGLRAEYGNTIMTKRLDSLVKVFSKGAYTAIIHNPSNGNLYVAFPENNTDDSHKRQPYNISQRDVNGILRILSKVVKEQQDNGTVGDEYKVALFAKMLKTGNSILGQMIIDETKEIERLYGNEEIPKEAYDTQINGLKDTTSEVFRKFTKQNFDRILSSEDIKSIGELGEIAIERVPIVKGYKKVHTEARALHYAMKTNIGQYEFNLGLVHGKGKEVGCCAGCTKEFNILKREEGLVVNRTADFPWNIPRNAYRPSPNIEEEYYVEFTDLGIKIDGLDDRGQRGDRDLTLREKELIDNLRYSLSNESRVITYNTPKGNLESSILQQEVNRCVVSNKILSSRLNEIQHLIRTGADLNPYITSVIDSQFVEKKEKVRQIAKAQVSRKREELEESSGGKGYHAELEEFEKRIDGLCQQELKELEIERKGEIERACLDPITFLSTQEARLHVLKELAMDLQNDLGVLTQIEELEQRIQHIQAGSPPPDVAAISSGSAEEEKGNPLKHQTAQSRAGSQHSDDPVPRRTAEEEENYEQSRPEVQAMLLAEAEGNIKAQAKLPPDRSGAKVRTPEEETKTSKNKSAAENVPIGDETAVSEALESISQTNVPTTKTKNYADLLSELKATATQAKVEAINARSVVVAARVEVKSKTEVFEAAKLKAYEVWKVAEAAMLKADAAVAIADVLSKNVNVESANTDVAERDKAVANAKAAKAERKELIAAARAAVAERDRVGSDLDTAVANAKAAKAEYERMLAAAKVAKTEYRTAIVKEPRYEDPATAAEMLAQINTDAATDESLSAAAATALQSSSRVEATNLEREGMKNEGEHLKRHDKDTIPLLAENKIKDIIFSENASSKELLIQLANESRTEATQDVRNVLSEKQYIQPSVEDQSKEAGADPKAQTMPSVEFMQENDHGIDHSKNVTTLIDRIKSGGLINDPSNPIAILLERKSMGKNMGMADVILLSKILEYNTDPKNIDNQIVLPEGIKQSKMYESAQLYSVAKANNIAVIGAEGSNLEHTRADGEELYNKDREKAMSDMIISARERGYNVVMPVGSEHIKNLESRVKESTQESAEAAIKEINAKFDVYKAAKLLGMGIKQHLVKTTQASKKSNIVSSPTHTIPNPQSDKSPNRG